MLTYTSAYKQALVCLCKVNAKFQVRLSFECDDASVAWYGDGSWLRNWRNTIDRALLRNNDSCSHPTCLDYERFSKIFKDSQRCLKGMAKRVSRPMWPGRRQAGPGPEAGAACRKIPHILREQRRKMKTEASYYYTRCFLCTFILE